MDIRYSKVRVPRVTLNVGGVAADENYTMCGPSFHVSYRLLSKHILLPSVDSLTQIQYSPHSAQLLHDVAKSNTLQV